MIRYTKKHSAVFVSKPTFLITIDTEGDNLWSSPERITTKNTNFLPRFQNLCEKYGFKPTYLTNHEMARDPHFIEFGRDILARDTGEIGMHLHAWNSPPISPLTPNDNLYQPYLIEYPKGIIKEKIVNLTNKLEDIFQVKMLSHRAGRWAFNEIYAQVLFDLGYKVDCSVTPHISWQEYSGSPSQNGGTNYFQFPEHHYFADLDNISNPVESGLLEIPMTVFDTGPPITRFLKMNFRRSSLIHRLVNKLYPTVWFRPTKRNLGRLLHTVDLAINSRRDYLMFMLHSSELMPGGNPTFLSMQDIEQLYADLEILFSAIATRFTGRTLTEFYHFIAKK